MNNIILASHRFTRKKEMRKAWSSNDINEVLALLWPGTTVAKLLQRYNENNSNKD